MNRIVTLARSEPVVLTTAVRSVLAVLVLFHVVDLSGEQVAGIIVAQEAMLALFVRQVSTPNVHVEEQVNAAGEEGMALGAADEKAAIHEYLQVEGEKQAALAAFVPEPEPPAPRRPRAAVRKPRPAL